ncbi:MAG: beta strand repeat-containing protein, partial [Bacteroidales bacterium]
WYNTSNSRLEGSCDAANYGYYPLDGSGTPSGNYSAYFSSGGVPIAQSGGVRNSNNGEILFYGGSTYFYRYNSSGTQLGTVNITKPSGVFFNTTHMIYTGISGQEVGFYDYTNKKVYLYSINGGASTYYYTLPASAPANSNYGFAFANGRIFLSGLGAGTWYGYPVVATIPGTPTTLVATPSGATTANISWAAGSPVGTPAPTYYWIVKNTGGAIIVSGSTTGTSAAVTGLTANTTYYFTVDGGNTAGYSALATSSNFTTYPADPTSITASNATICSGTSTTLTAVGAQGTVYWYFGGCNGTQVATGNTYSPTLSGTTTYYARNNNGNWSAGCASTTITVNPLPATASAVTATPATVCVNTASNLNATSTGNTINWYTAATGGTLLGTSASGANYIVTPASTTTYYAEVVTDGSQTLDYTGSIVNFTVPAGVTSLTIDAIGAAGGRANATYAKGARIKGTVSVTSGQVLKILVGQKGSGLATEYSSGGGGSFVTDNSNNPLVIAGGGGGYYGYLSMNSNASITTSGNNASATNGGGLGGTNGGAGQANTCSPNGGPGGGLTGEWNSAYLQGGHGGRSFINGGAGGAAGSYVNMTSTPGGFGGGGGSAYSSGGGGGYSGGGGGANCGSGPQDGGGGGSYNSGTNKIETVGYNQGNGQVILTWTSATSCPSASRTAVTLTATPVASVASVTGTTPLNVAGIATYTANTVVLSGGTGAWSSSNTAVATVIASTGVVTAVAGGTCNIVYTITGGCGATVTAQQALTVNAPVTVTGSTGANGSYGRLGLAFTAINGNVQTGNTIVITITGNTTETASAVLNAGVWTTLKIYPTVTGLSITGNVAAPLIDLAGADNVTIDGRVNATGSAKDLIITNTSLGVASTIRFMDDAATNAVKYCALKGSGTDVAAGVLFFSTTTGSNGNDGNLIDNNNITNSADLNRPWNAVYSAGTASKTNSGNTISNNNFYNFFNRESSSNGI